MKKAEYIFNKYANIYGLDSPAHMYNQRYDLKTTLPVYQEYNKLKASESKSRWPVVLPTSAGMGAGIGALAGMGTGAMPYTMVAGASLGVLLGIISKLYDDGKVDEARRLVASSNFQVETKAALLKELDLYDRTLGIKTYITEERRHQATINALQKR